MNAHLAKAVCHQVAEDLKGHKVAAELAGVAPSVWSDYCNFDKPDTTLPLHRAMAIHAKTKRDYFSRLFTVDDAAAAAVSADPRILGAGALEAIALAEVRMAQAYADGTITEAEKREMLALTQLLVERSCNLNKGVAAILTGAPLKAVS